MRHGKTRWRSPGSSVQYRPYGLDLFRLLGLLLIIVAAQQIAKIIKRSINRLNPTRATCVYLLSRLAATSYGLSGAHRLNFLGFELSSFAFLGGRLAWVGLRAAEHTLQLRGRIIILFEKRSR